MAQGEIQQTTGVWHDCDEAARSFDVHAKRENLSLGGKQLPMDPSTCIFWCAVALGALVKGNPIESVRDSCISPFHVRIYIFVYFVHQLEMLFAPKAFGNVLCNQLVPVTMDHRKTSLQYTISSNSL